MAEARLTPKPPNYSLRRRVAGAALATAVGAGLLASGVMNEKEPSETKEHEARVQTLKDTINTLPRDQHVLSVVARSGDSVWGIVESVADAQGVSEFNPQTAVDQILETNTELRELTPGEIVPVDLSLIEK